MGKESPATGRAAAECAGPADGARLARVLRATRSCLLTVDASPSRAGRVLACRGTDAVLGLPPRDLVADPARWTGYVAAGDRERLRAGIQAVCAGRATAPFVMGMGLPDGRVRRIRIEFPLPSVPGGGAAECELLLTDVTREYEARDSRRQTIRRLCRLATLDALTGLCNRRGLRDAMRRAWSLAQRRGAQTGIVMLDIDGFKAVNDESGHAAGDDVLRAAAERVRSALRVEDVVCRYGGDELVVLLPLADRAGTQAVAERLLQAFRSRDFEAGGRRLAVRVSIGAACGSVREYPGPEALLHEADRVLGQAKREGRDRMCIGGVSMPAGVAGRGM